MKGIVIFLSLLLVSTQVVFSQAEPTISVQGMEKRGDSWFVLAALWNVSGNKISVGLASTVTDSAGKHYPMQALDLSPYGKSPDTSYVYQVFGAGLSVESGDKGTRLEQPAGDPNRLMMLLPFEFRLPPGVKPVRFFFSSGARGVDLAGVPAPPLLVAPKIAVSGQPPGIAMSVGKVACAIGALAAESATDSSGLASALNHISPSPDGRLTLTTITDFSSGKSDVWVVASVSLKNPAATSVAVPLERIVLEPTGMSKKEAELVGIAEKGVCRVGQPFAGTVNLAAGETRTVVLVYRPAEWWFNKYALRSI